MSVHPLRSAPLGRPRRWLASGRGKERPQTCKRSHGCAASPGPAVAHRRAGRRGRCGRARPGGWRALRPVRARARGWASGSENVCHGLWRHKRWPARAWRRHSSPAGGGVGRQHPGLVGEGRCGGGVPRCAVRGSCLGRSSLDAAAAGAAVGGPARRDALRAGLCAGALETGLWGMCRASAVRFAQ